MPLHTCDLCKQPAKYKYKALWCCQAHYEERRAMFDRFYSLCKRPDKCGQNMLPSECERCGFVAIRDKQD